ncbi:MAG: hypothetical protein EXR72_06340 [Myxococcales bacterium]|nr:hypothetical protein [Myxococcales bacterium]
MLPISAEMKLTVAKNIDVSQYTEGTLKLRLHAVDVSGAATNDWEFEVILQVDATTVEDPAVNWQPGGGMADPASITLPVTSAGAGQVFYVEITKPFGAVLKLLVRAKQGTAAYTTFNVTISADIEAKY